MLNGLNGACMLYCMDIHNIIHVYMGMAIDAHESGREQFVVWKPYIIDIIYR